MFWQLSCTARKVLSSSFCGLSGQGRVEPVVGSSGLWSFAMLHWESKTDDSAALRKDKMSQARSYKSHKRSSYLYSVFRECSDLEKQLHIASP